jgi:two-component system OmpR family response regulator
MEPRARTLVVSPDRAVLRTAEGCFTALAHLPQLARTLADAQRLLGRAWVDLLVLDSLLSRDDTDQFIRCLASDGLRGAPALLFLAPPSARLAPGTLPSCYRPDRDGLVTKPIDAGELAREVARVLAARPRERAAALLRVGSLALDCRTRQLLFADGGVLEPTPTEFRLLRCLMERAGELISADDLVGEVWNYPAGTGGSELVRAHVSNLRRKLRAAGQDPQLLRTVPYHGYAIALAESRVPAAARLA